MPARWWSGHRQRPAHGLLCRGSDDGLAARMEQLATPGSVLLTAATLRLVEGLVRVTALGPVPVKGLTEPVEVFERWGPVPCDGACRRPRRGGLDALVGRQTELAGLQQTLERAGQAMGRWWHWLGRRAWGNPAWSMSSSTPTRSQAGGCWRVPRYPTGRRRPIFRCSSRCAPCHVEEHDDSRTIRAKVTGQVLTLDEAPGHHPGPAGSAGRPSGGEPVPWARSAAAAPAHAGGAQARAATRESGATPAASV